MPAVVPAISLAGGDLRVAGEVLDPGDPGGSSASSMSITGIPSSILNFGPHRVQTR